MDTSSNRVSTWTYDAAGNVLDDGNHTYSYDANNRQIDLDGATAVYGYDAGGQRVTKIKNGTTTYQLSSGRYQSASGWKKVFVSLGREKLLEYTDTTTHFFHANHLGSPTKKTDLTGSETASWESLPFGEEWTLSGSFSRHKFTGHWRDGESNNDYAGARFYSNGNGRWLGVDRVRGLRSKPQSLNRYAYSFNDPINYWDPDGNFPLDIVAVELCNVGLCNHTSVVVVAEADTVELPLPGGPGGVGGGGQGNGGGGGGSTGGQPGSPSRDRVRDCLEAYDGPLPGDVDSISAEEMGDELLDNIMTMFALESLGIPMPNMAGGDIGEWLAGQATAILVWLTNVWPGGNWDYNDVESDQEDLGNFNYGMTGSFYFPPNLLERMGGVVGWAIGDAGPRVWLNNPQRFLEDLLNANAPWGQSPFGDSQLDREMIQNGIQFGEYMQDCLDN